MTPKEIIWAVVLSCAAYGYQYATGRLDVGDISSVAVPSVWVVCLLGAYLSLAAARTIRREDLASWSEWEPRIVADVPSEDVRPRQPHPFPIIVAGALSASSFAIAGIATFVFAPTPRASETVPVAVAVPSSGFSVSEELSRFATETELNEDRNQIEDRIFRTRDRSRYVLDWRLPGVNLVPLENYDGPKQFHTMVATAPDCSRPSIDWQQAEVRGRGRRTLATAPFAATYYDAYGPVSFIEVQDARDGLIAELNFEANRSFWPSAPNGWVKTPWLVSADSRKIILGTLCTDLVKQEQQLRFWEPTLGQQVGALIAILSWKTDPLVTSASSKALMLPGIALQIRVTDGTRTLFERQLVIQPESPRYGVGRGQIVAWERK